MESKLLTGERIFEQPVEIKSDYFCKHMSQYEKGNIRFAAKVSLV